MDQIARVRGCNHPAVPLSVSVIVIEAPETAAPLESVTRPLTEPKVACAIACEGTNARRALSKQKKDACQAAFRLANYWLSMERKLASYRNPPNRFFAASWAHAVNL